MNSFRSTLCFTYNETFEVDGGVLLCFIIMVNPLCQLGNIMPYGKSEKHALAYNVIELGSKLGSK